MKKRLKEEEEEVEEVEEVEDEEDEDGGEGGGNRVRTNSLLNVCHNHERPSFKLRSFLFEKFLIALNNI